MADVSFFLFFLQHHDGAQAMADISQHDEALTNSDIESDNASNEFASDHEGQEEKTVYNRRPPRFAAVKPNPLFPENEQMACIMLSELFLDIDIVDTEIEFRFVARGLKPLGLLDADLDRLLYYDVFPILWLNLTGEWIGRDGEWLLRYIGARRKSALWRWVTKPGHVLAWLLLSGSLVKDLEEVKRRIMMSDLELFDNSYLFK
jgi:hypothetical protein